MSMFNFAQVGNIQEAGNTSKKLAANAIHKVVITSMVAEDNMKTVNGPANVLRIVFTGVEGENEGATFEYIIFPPKPTDNHGKIFDDGSEGVAPIFEKFATIRQLLTAVSPAYAEYVKGGAEETYSSWEEWRNAIIKFATPGIKSKKEFEIKLFGVIKEYNGSQYLNPVIPTFFLGKKKTGELFSKCTFFGHNLSFSQKWEKEKVAFTQNALVAQPSDMPISLTSEDNAAKSMVASISL